MEPVAPRPTASRVPGVARPSANGLPSRRRPLPPGCLRLWLPLLVPVVATVPLSGAQQAVAVADYASIATSARLSYRGWSFLNAELTVHLTRDPQGPWVGLDCEGVVQRVGAGLSTARLYDAAGRLGQSAQTLVVEHL